MKLTRRKVSVIFLIVTTILLASIFLDNVSFAYINYNNSTEAETYKSVVSWTWVKDKKLWDINNSGKTEPFYYTIGNSNEETYFCMNHGRPIALRYTGNSNGSTQKTTDVILEEQSANLNKDIDAKSGDMEASVGFAYYWLEKHGYEINTNGEDFIDELQNIIWNSDTYTGKSNVVDTGKNETRRMDSTDYNSDDENAEYVTKNASSGSLQDIFEHRSYNYANVYYAILNDLNEKGEHTELNNTPLFQVLNKDGKPVTEEDINVYVDQNTNRYTMGPYTLRVNPNNKLIKTSNLVKRYGENGAIKIAKKLLYDEITKNIYGYKAGTLEPIKSKYSDVYLDDYSKFFKDGNGDVNYADTFASFDISKDLTISESADNTTNKLLDEDGNELTFPDFVSEKNFYIEFTPKEDGAICETGYPLFSVSFLNRFKGKVSWFGGKPKSVNDGKEQNNDGASKTGSLSSYEDSNDGSLQAYKFNTLNVTVQNPGDAIFSDFQGTYSWNKATFANGSDTSSGSYSYSFPPTPTPENDGGAKGYDDLFWEGTCTITIPVHSKNEKNSEYHYDVVIKNVPIKLYEQYAYNVGVETSSTTTGYTPNLADPDKPFSYPIYNVTWKINRSGAADNQPLPKPEDMSFDYEPDYKSDKNTVQTITFTNLFVSSSDTTNGDKNATTGISFTVPGTKISKGSQTTIEGVGKAVKMQKYIQVHEVEFGGGVQDVIVPGSPQGFVEQQLGGHVWIEGTENKDSRPDGIRRIGDANSTDKVYAGILVSLYDATTKSQDPVAVTTTDKTGQYRFYGHNSTIVNYYNKDTYKECDASDPNAYAVYEPIMNPMHDYYVTFLYNGELYEATYYKEDISWKADSNGNVNGDISYSNAREDNRDAFNGKLEKINGESVIEGNSVSYNPTSTNANNGGVGRVFALDEKLERDNHEYISIDYNFDSQYKDAGNYLAMNSSQVRAGNRALTFRDAWNIFVNLATSEWECGLNDSPTAFDGTLDWYAETKQGIKGIKSAPDPTTHITDFDQLFGKLVSELEGLGVGSQDANDVRNYIENILISAKTIKTGENADDGIAENELKTYPVYDYYVLGSVTEKKDISHAKEIKDEPLEIFKTRVKQYNPADLKHAYHYLYNQSYDQARFVDFGIYKREDIDLSLQKDAYKATVIVNGKKQDYYYDKKISSNRSILFKLRNANGGVVDTISKDNIKSLLENIGAKNITDVQPVGTEGYSVKFTYGDDGTVYVAEASKQGIPSIYQESWKIEVRASDALYNGSTSYYREVRPSEYLYDGTDSDTGVTNENNADDKNLQIFVTYRIEVSNNGQTDAKVNEIVDYYDADNYVYDGVLNGDTYEENVYQDENGTYVNSYMGIDRNGTAMLGNNAQAKSDKNANISLGTNSSKQYSGNAKVENADLLVVKTKGQNGESEYITNESLSSDPYYQYNPTDKANLGGEARSFVQYEKGQYNYRALYITNKNTNASDPALNGQIYDENGNATNYYHNLLKPGEGVYVYLTFKCLNTTQENGSGVTLSNDPSASKIKLDQNLTTAQQELGKRNIAEINSYSTYYRSEGSTIPDSLGDNNERRDTDVSGKRAGLVDINSTPGSLTSYDLNSDGRIRLNGSDPSQDRLENDTDSAPNVVVKIADNQDTRVIQGKVYEDQRNTTSTGNSLVGNGSYDDSTDTLIDGVTVQLVELVQKVTQGGLSTGEYIGEKIWASYTYGSTKPSADASKTYERNNSGWVPQVVINYNDANNANATKILGISPDKIKEVLKDGTYTDDLKGIYEDGSGNKLPALTTGQYAFVSVPTGDFYVRFIYGDTNDTVLERTMSDTDDSSVDAEAQVVDTLIGKSGKNTKSYNGQDYKSTTYQPAVSQSSNYNGINGYAYNGDYDTQNYTTVDNITVDPQGSSYDRKNSDPSNSLVSLYNVKKLNATKANMYYYNVNESEGKNVSDAKDVYVYRDRSNSYSKGANNAKDILSGAQNVQVLTNNRAEVLASPTQVATEIKNNIVSKASTYVKLTSETMDGNITPESARQFADPNGLQAKMVDEMRYNTFGVAQTGIIDAKVEKNKDEGNNTITDNTQTDAGQYALNTEETANSGVTSAASEYKLIDIDLGLEERPEAQLKLTKQVGHYRITLSGGYILFDAGATVKDAYFAEHKGHNIYNSKDDNSKKKAADGNENKDDFKLARLAKVSVSANSTSNPEIIQPYMDDELMDGATIEVTYSYTVENVGEVDFKDKKFYYTGSSDNSISENVVKTDPTLVIDYLANTLKFDSENHNAEVPGKVWNLTTQKELVRYNEDAYSTKATSPDADVTLDNNTINKIYNDRLGKYNTLLITDSLSTIAKYNNGITNYGLVPARFQGGDTQESKSNSALVVSTIMSTNNSNYDMVYNNLAEIVATSNEAGRRMQYSIAGNQPMADQSLLSDNYVTGNGGVLTYEDLVTPTEIDADSAQKIMVTTPTGENKNFLPWIIGTILAAGIIGISIVLIKKKVTK